MKKVLFIAYQFPPIGGSGVQRSLKFVRYLPDFGWLPVVLTRKTDRIALRDDSMIKEVPSNINIIRTTAWDFTELPGFIASMAGKVLARKVLIPDGERMWQIFSLSAAVRIIRENEISLVYTTSYPYSSHLLGLKLKKKLLCNFKPLAN